MKLPLQRKTLINILGHIGYWLLFLAAPVMLFYSLISVKNQADNMLDIVRLVYTCLLLIAMFYFNYYYLIPKYLFSRKFLKYSLLLFLLYLALCGLPVIYANVVLRVQSAEPAALEFSDLFLLILMYTMLFVVTVSLRMRARWQHTEKEKLAAQLTYLKAQINPHFLFNILNGIYSETIEKAPQAADMIEKLSAMMRYTLHETKADYVPLEKELGFIQNYIDLQKNRFDENVKFSFSCQGDFENNQIAPLLLIPFIENAFKHGVNSEQNSAIAIKISCHKNELLLVVKNNKVDVEWVKNEAGGLGIANTQNRLQLIYPNKHHLTIDNAHAYYSVTLKLHLI
jgi:sensor histidine kinase YesM